MNERDSAGGQRDWANQRAFIEAHAGDRIALVVDSFHRLVGTPLVSDKGDLRENLWTLPSVVVAHATEDDPVFFYANRAALSLFEASAQDFVRMPSRFSAEPVERSERARFMAQVLQENIITNYRGIRISRTGRRFAIERAIVWNLVDEAGLIHGQAATFAEWTPLST